MACQSRRFDVALLIQVSARNSLIVIDSGQDLEEVICLK
jgi:hypothetical protein